MRAPLCAGPEYTDDFSNAMLEELDNEVVHSMLAGLSESKVLRVNTMCAGSESPLLNLQSLQKVINIRGGTVKFRHGFSSEFNEDKVKVIIKAFPQISKIFKDVTQLWQAYQTNLLTGQEDEVDDCDLNIAGFPCQDASRLNPHSSSLKNCSSVAEGSLRTGSVFHGICSYLQGPGKSCKMLMLENVEGLMQLPKVNGVVVGISNLEASNRHLMKTTGFIMVIFLLDPRRHFGMPVSRRRLWMPCCSMAWLTECELTKALYEQKMWDTMDKMTGKLGMMDLDRFYLKDKDPIVEMHAMELSAKEKQAKNNEKSFMAGEQLTPSLVKPSVLLSGQPNNQKRKADGQLTPSHVKPSALLKCPSYELHRIGQPNNQKRKADGQLTPSHVKRRAMLKCSSSAVEGHEQAEKNEKHKADGQLTPSQVKLRTLLKCSSSASDGDLKVKKGQQWINDAIACLGGGAEAMKQIQSILKQKHELKAHPRMNGLSNREYLNMKLGLKKVRKASVPTATAHVFNVSQSLPRQGGNIANLHPCITPDGKYVNTKLARIENAFDLLHLQGIFYKEEQMLAREFPNDLIQDLAGNAFNTPCCLASLICLFCVAFGSRKVHKLSRSVIGSGVRGVNWNNRGQGAWKVTWYKHG